MRAFVILIVSVFIFRYFETPLPDYRTERAPAANSIKPSTIAVTNPPPKAIPSNGKQGIHLPPPIKEPSHGDFLSRYRDVSPSRASLPGYDLMRLRAIQKDRYRPGLGTQIDEKFGFVIYAADGQSDLMVDDGLPVVAKNTNGILGIVTGTLIVTLREGALALDLAKDYGLKVIYFDEDLRLAYYSAPEKSSLDSVVETLKRDRLVESVNLEVIQSRKKF